MIIIHGENQIASRQHFLSQKESAETQGLNIVDFAGESLLLSDLIQATESSSLFGTVNLVFIEGFFSRRPSNDKKRIVEYFISKNQNTNLFLWDAKDISAQIKDFSPNTIKRFDLPKYIFSFLDDLDLSTFRKCLENMPVEQLFASLITRLHKVLVGEGRFKKPFSTSQLAIMNSQLLKIDYAQKTGAAPYDLTTALELWLLKL